MQHCTIRHKIALTQKQKYKISSAYLLELTFFEKCSWKKFLEVTFTKRKYESKPSFKSSLNGDWFMCFRNTVLRNDIQPTYTVLQF